ncbi:MAG TPA: class I SAM-dependent methyltransferase, partial [Aquifex aeolicus]|nr:class I SAM-dependent methyltransferase [Aquifex aeolicus]
MHFMGPLKRKKASMIKVLNYLEVNIPYLVKVKPKSKVKKLERASKIFKLMGINWRDILTDYGAKLLSEVIEGNLKVLKKINKERVIDKFYRPPLFSTTLWDFPKQSYGDTPKGNNRYPGVTPAFIIYNLIHRYTEPGDLVLDPMAGSGTTIDVCKEEGRKVIAFDIVPTRKDIIQADARSMPIKSESVDFIFIDSPYSDNIRYNDHPKNIGHIPATDESFFDELEKVMKEAYRVLKQGKYLAWLIGDQWA